MPHGSRDSKRSDRPKHDRGKDKASSSGDYNNTDRIGFIFVVNELHMRAGGMEHDGWNNGFPRADPSFYYPEIPSQVMRYYNGEVSPTNLEWYRDPDTQQGAIYWREGNQWAEPYAIASVFSCNPLLPIIVAKGDVSCTPGLAWEPLLFFHPADPAHPMRGVSLAVFEEDLTMADVGGSPVKFVAGKDPSWIPALVPETYRYPYATSTASRGLGGDPAIVLGLMAFSAPLGDRINDDMIEEMSMRTSRAERVFLGSHPRWRNRRWLHSGAPEGYTGSTQDYPQGFLVSVYVDPVNSASTQEALALLQRSKALVKEGH